MAFMLARQGVRPEISEELDRIMDGSHLPEHFQELARDLPDTFDALRECTAGHDAPCRIFKSSPLP